MEECSICLCPLDGTITVVGCCKKQFHTNCLLKCIERKNECPLCRRQGIIEKENVVVVHIEQDSENDIRMKRRLCIAYVFTFAIVVSIVNMYKNFAPW
jgi:hypothetical protein